ncbi:hypothetical protein L208DRAFT_1379058 [Tricholoma matsutake]|nr:hypothetical protein L208DRAFT_1379058 [Tricholoma matsutake 945]
MSPEWLKKWLEKVTEKDLWLYKLAIGMPEEIAQHSFFSAQNKYSWVNVNQYELYIQELIGQSGKVADPPALVLNEVTSGSVKAEKLHDDKATFLGTPAPSQQKVIVIADDSKPEKNHHSQGADSNQK